MLVYIKHTLITVVFTSCLYIKLLLSLSGLAWVFNCFDLFIVYDELVFIGLNSARVHFIKMLVSFLKYKDI